MELYKIHNLSRTRVYARKIKILKPILQYLEYKKKKRGFVVYSNNKL